MVKVNKRLLPIKAHYLFFMGAMGPILPQLPVLGKQIGISPEIMGYITSILPIMYVIAKPLFGFIADYFTSLRKMVFMFLIATMTLFFLALYFIPNTQMYANDFNQSWNVTFYNDKVHGCSEQLMSSPSLCQSTTQANCLTNQLIFRAYFTNLNFSSNLNLVNNVDELPYMHMCFPDIIEMLQENATEFNASCHMDMAQPYECLYSSTVFWLFVTFMCIGTIGFNVVNSISDAICFDVLGEEEEKYGVQRVWGTIGFGATAFLAGVFVDYWTTDTAKSFTPALVILFICSLLDIMSVCKLKLPKLSASESIFKDVWTLVKHPAISSFLVFATITGILDSFIIYFLFWHLEDVAAETGYMGNIKLIEGCVVAAECLAGEVPFFFFSGKIIKKLGYIHCMSLCFFCYAIRLTLISWIPNPWYLVAVEFFLQGCTYALSYTCIVAYASAVAPPGTSATVQGLMAGMDDGLGFSIGSLIGGVAYKNYGGRRSFFYFGIAAIITCFLHIAIRPSSRKKQYLPKSEYQVPKEQISVTLLES